MKKLLFLISLFILSPVNVGAFSLQTAPEININDDSIVEENLYLSGGSVSYDKVLENDVLIVGGQSKIDGVTFGDLQVYSGEVLFSGEAFGDSRFLTGNLSITGNTNGDLVVVGGKTSIKENAILNGKSLIVSGEVDVSGQVLDDLKIIASKVFIDAEILGDVEVTAQEVYIGDNAKLNGDFVYFAPTKADIKNGAQIKEGFVYNQIESIDENRFVKKTVLNFVTFWSVIKFLATLFTAFILVFVFRMFSQRVSYLACNKLGKSFIVGLVSVPLIPIFIIILLASLFGMPIAGILFFVYMIIMFLTAPVSGIILGYFIKTKTQKSKKVEVDFNTATLGIIILTFLYFIPVFGAILNAFVFIVSVGAMILYIFEVVTIKKK
jgi:cytoskeletal protein CcmA (bactofilin family)